MRPGIARVAENWRWRGNGGQQLGVSAVVEIIARARQRRQLIVGDTVSSETLACRAWRNFATAPRPISARRNILPQRISIILWHSWPLSICLHNARNIHSYFERCIAIKFDGLYA